jgi:hypothetical protein
MKIFGLLNIANRSLRRSWRCGIRAMLSIVPRGSHRGVVDCFTLEKIMLFPDGTRGQGDFCEIGPLLARYP